MSRSSQFLACSVGLSLLAGAWKRAEAQERGCPGWHEPLGQDTAGSLPAQAKTPYLCPGVTTLDGRLDGHYTGPGPPYDDFEDMFLIKISGSDPQSFYVKTVPMFTPDALTNTMLWLFRPDGMGLLANDDTAIGSTVLQSPFSLIDFGDLPPNLPLVDCYYLAISGYNNNPVGQLLKKIWNLPPTGVWTPNGPGAALPIDGWDHHDPNLSGVYEIELGGVEYCPEPASLIPLSFGLLLVRRPHRCHRVGPSAVCS